MGYLEFERRNTCTCMPQSGHWKQVCSDHTAKFLKTPYLPIVPSSCHDLTVRAVVQDVHVVEVSLLFEDVGL